jgi:acetylornithine/succinyldiaminopimelate/putrescine aminotransferase
MSTIDKFNEYVMHTYGRYPLVMEKGSGRTCVDADGKKYIDFGSGIGTNSLGYCLQTGQSRSAYFKLLLYGGSGGFCRKAL